MHSAVGAGGDPVHRVDGASAGRGTAPALNGVDLQDTCIARGETKTCHSLRPLSRGGFALADVQPSIADKMFASGSQRKGCWGLPRLWLTVQRTAKRLVRKEAAACGAATPATGPLDGLTPHSLHHGSTAWRAHLETRGRAADRRRQPNRPVDAARRRRLTSLRPSRAWPPTVAVASHSRLTTTRSRCDYGWRHHIF